MLKEQVLVSGKILDGCGSNAESFIRTSMYLMVYMRSPLLRWRNILSLSGIMFGNIFTSSWIFEGIGFVFCPFLMILDCKLATTSWVDWLWEDCLFPFCFGIFPFFSTCDSWNSSIKDKITNCKLNFVSRDCLFYASEFCQKHRHMILTLHLVTKFPKVNTFNFHTLIQIDNIEKTIMFNYSFVLTIFSINFW